MTNPAQPYYSRQFGNSLTGFKQFLRAALLAITFAAPPLFAGETNYILTPPAPATPRINGAKITGVRPGHPFLFQIPATGERPLTFTAKRLPRGLSLDPQTGLITGSVVKPGTYRVQLTAKNNLGAAKRELRVVVGENISLTPPMGWNSWNCFANAVSAQHIRDATDAMVQSGLINHGWTYINIDDFWQVIGGKTHDFWQERPDLKDPTLLGPARDAEGRILPNPRFPDMKKLADYIHAHGLKAGIYSSPGPLTCGGCIASYQHEEQDARSYADWGFDYLKYDWCSYGDLAKDKSLPELKKPYALMSEALRKQNRDILFSLCQYGMGEVWNWGAEVGGNCWRTSGDIVDTWAVADHSYQGSVSGIGFSQTNRAAFAGPGHWNDPDMLVIGKVGWGPKLHPTRLTPDEQYAHISLWCLLAAPLLIGCDMTQLDDFTLGLLTNDEVIEVNQDPLGRQAERISQDGDLEVWAKDMEDGSKAVGLFNRSEAPAKVTAKLADLKLKGSHSVRDLWRQKDLGRCTGEFTATVPSHGVMLVRISKK